LRTFVAIQKPEEKEIREGSPVRVLFLAPLSPSRRQVELAFPMGRAGGLGERGDRDSRRIDYEIGKKANFSVEGKRH